MQAKFSITADEGRRAKWPHEIFLINLIFNHVLVFVGSVAVVNTLPLAPTLVPAVSLAIIGYILFKARRVAASDESWFVKSHWRIAAERNRIFILLLAGACAVCGGGLWLSQLMGWPRIPTIALISGVGLLPFMVSLLALIILASDSMHQARAGRLPQRFLEKHPQPR